MTRVNRKYTPLREVYYWLLVSVVLVCALAFWVLVGYVALHFLQKAW